MLTICHVVLLPVILLLSAPTSFSPPYQECHHPPLRAVLQGRNYHKAAKHLTKKTLTCKQMGSSSVHKCPGRQTHPHPRRTFCVCMYVSCRVGQKYKLKVSAGEGRYQKRGLDFFLGAIKMHHPQQIRMQSLHAATKPDKTHMSMSEVHGSPYMTHPIR